MKTTKNILIAFLLNLSFSLFELVGGLFTGSVAILSDAVHDLGDAAGIGTAYLLERKSHRAPDADYTYGYARYSVIGGVITTLILIVGSTAVIGGAVARLFHPTPIHYDGMIVFAVFGIVTNLTAALVTRHGDSLNQKAVNLHMLEDVLGWVVVLVGAIVMRFTELIILDPLMSIGVAVFILLHAVRTLQESVDVFLEKTPQDIEMDHLTEAVKAVPHVHDVHHIHVWSMDGSRHYATLHIVTDGDPQTVKRAVRDALREHGIAHATLELESPKEACEHIECHIEHGGHGHHHHHHHHHH